MNQITSTIIKHTGTYKGIGINHDGDKFTGLFQLTPIIDNKGIEISFTAKGEDGTIYHQEKSTIAPSEDGTICLWTLNNNVPFQYAHELEECETVEGAKNTFKFSHNKPSDLDKFREAISIDIWANGDISYRYAWGMPNGEFEDRSGLRMTKQ